MAMRVAVVGATGNTGTALLSELSSRPEVTSVLGIARRLPHSDSEPYEHAEWATVDIQDPDSRGKLASLFADVDAVVHLAWLIQPNSQRELLRRVNVEGTQNVLEAAAAAGVRRIAVASSVGAYSPVQDDRRRDETWPTEGIPGSHYSQDKAAQERVIDTFVAEHPDISVARLRPGLIFQASAGAEIQRYFLGRAAPVQLLGAVRLPALPVPAGVRAQAVHAADVAVAYAEVIIRGAHGAYNIASDDVLDAQSMADTVSPHGGGARGLPLPMTLTRPMVKALHRSRLVPMDEGWLDMATTAPMMDITKAKNELGWQPRTTGAQALAELLDGLRSGRGARSAPMRPRGRSPVASPPLPRRGHRVPEDLDRDLLRSYMADHLAGATAGMKRIQRMAEAFEDAPVYPQLSEVSHRICAERSWLKELIRRQGFHRPAVRASVSWAGERLARLKPYSTPPAKRSPAALVLEAELMIGAITAKQKGWEALAEYAPYLGLVESVFEDLVSAANDQARHMSEVHRYARRRAFYLSAGPIEETSERGQQG